jgi:hypothetical protein
LTPEAKIKKLIDRVLLGAYACKPIGSPFGKPSLDYLVCRLGYFAAIEAKAPKKQPTARQTETMRQILDAGGSVFLIDNSLGPDILELEGWLKTPQVKFISRSAYSWLTSQGES